MISSEELERLVNESTDLIVKTCVIYSIGNEVRYIIIIKDGSSLVHSSLNYLDRIKGSDALATNALNGINVLDATIEKLHRMGYTRKLQLLVDEANILEYLDTVSYEASEDQKVNAYMDALKAKLGQNVNITVGALDANDADVNDYLELIVPQYF